MANAPIQMKAVRSTSGVQAQFMELRSASAWLRRLTDLWLLVTAVVLLGLYLAGEASH